MDISKSSSITKLKTGAQLTVVLWLGQEEHFKKCETEIVKYFGGAKYGTYGEVVSSIIIAVYSCLTGTIIYGYNI